MKKVIVTILWLILLGYGFWNFGDYRYNQGVSDTKTRDEILVKLLIELQDVERVIQQHHIKSLERELRRIKAKREI